MDFPPLESLTRRLAETPADFLAEPQINRSGTVSVPAVVADLFNELGYPQASDSLQAFTSNNKKDRNRLRLVLIASWLLHDPFFRSQPKLAHPALMFLYTGLPSLANLSDAERFVRDPDRREELARLCLQSLGLRPAGESEAQALDRLATLNTAERQRVIAAARAAEERAQEIRRKMAAEAARAAEAKMMPE